MRFADESEDGKIKCPYCGHMHDEWYDWFSYIEEVIDGAETDIDCNNCEKEFDVVLDISYTLNSYKKEEKNE